jgi:hypothetical protein
VRNDALATQKGNEMPSTDTQASVNPNDVLTQLVTGPSIREVATNVLRPALKKLYPDLKTDPAHMMVVTPRWMIVDDQVQPGPLRFEALTDVLVRLAISETTVTYIEGEHFLSLAPGVDELIHLPVRIDAIGHLLNEQASVLFVAYQEQQLEYWNQVTSNRAPRWTELSTSLRQLWNVHGLEDWDAHQLAVASALFNHPDATERHSQDIYKTRACLIDMDRVDDGVSTHLNRTDLAVLIGTHEQRTIILSHSIATGFRAYASLEKLGESLFEYVEPLPVESRLQWRLFEPSGNFFDHQASTLIALQADAIIALNFNRRHKPPIVTAHADAPVDNQRPSVNQHSTRFQEVRRLLPDWLDNAAPADLSRYSRHLLDLALVQVDNNGKAFDSDIAPIRQFALDALRHHMLTLHPDAAALNLDAVQIVIQSQVVWGLFTAPGMTETKHLSLTDLALENLIAIPLGNVSIGFTDGTAVPEWMSVDYLKNAIKAVDIGLSYPTSVKSKLLDDPVQSLQRQQLFASNLRVQLPMQALQHKILGEHGINDLGYRYVCAAMEILSAKRWVDGQEIVIRPLAFVPSRRTNQAPDEVLNMYVIGPKEMDKGPCLLYRPLFSQPLMQYPSPANLLYAIGHSKELRSSILAWMSATASPNYSQYVFPGELPAVWTISQLLVEPLIALRMSGPVLLGQRVIENDRMATLFKANASALVMQGERSSVSNAESRWVSLKQGAWMLFSTVLPFMGRSAATAAWIWQILDDLQEAIDAHEGDDAPAQWSALTDLFLTLGMVLAHQATTRRQIDHERQTPQKNLIPENAPAPAAHVVIAERLPDIAGEYLPPDHQTSLHTTAVLNQSNQGLGPTLERFKIEKPQGLEPPRTEADLHQHLYQQGARWYAPVAERWFEVTVNTDELVQIIDTRQQPPLAGPLLVSNAKGEWFIDVRLRLRGGGRKSRLLAKQNENVARIASIKAHLADFDAQMESHKQTLVSAHTAMKNASPDEHATREQAFLDKLDARISDYENTLEQFKSLNLLVTLPQYRSATIEMLTAQLFFNQNWIDQKYPAFRAALGITLEHFDKEELGEKAPPGAYQAMSDLTQHIIEKVDFAQSRFSQLKLLGKEGARVTLEYQDKLPTFNQQDLKSLQVSLAADLCLKPVEAIESAEQAEARIAIGQIVEDADLAVNGSMELISEDQALSHDERIEALNSLTEQFTAIEQRLKSFATGYPQLIVDAQLDRLRSRVGEFSQRTINHLADLLREQRQSEPQPGPSRRAASSSKRLIKTRFKGTLVGRPRKVAAGHPILVDVTAPMTGKVIATYHEKTPGIWVERVSKKPQNALTTPVSPSARIKAGTDLLGNVDAFTLRAEADAKSPGRVPVEIEEAFHRMANRLEEAAKAINTALAQSNSTQDHSETAKPVLLQLTEQAQWLYAEGNRLRLEMTKAQLPTAAHVEWLRSKGQVDIVIAGPRRRLKGSRKDFLQEYEVRENGTGNVLWYAHFHYSDLASDVMAYNAAHLKTREQRLLKGHSDVRATTSNKEAIEIYRSVISPQLARSLFLSQTTERT